ncbi:hypothetical protein FC816_00615 [Clostridium botulinum]|uniref:Uncharacterized protein n=1 Tax=Clostridium botulinum TaxID=1491 RepID=A0A6B4G2A9_CLOBO|nr:hypothetical protein [Clostridium botulinum]MBN3382928.1 hypothetical protein [Clostridium botulinum]NFF90080.1 hypothetical protein [Clostridium botulinum]NFG16866.1 hypothetical protein [Clostridium botulinum]NFG30631.1 hypothetical protein [Clostridium botulinum]NFG33774.1 hypothetical protein [Clostridium botulinum]
MSNSTESNSSKSLNGNQLNKKIGILLENFKQQNLIKNYHFEPRYNYPGCEFKQFSPDYEITLSNGDIIIIDNTTTARHDRFKQKQWDAYGTKSHFKGKNKEVKYYIVLPNNDEIGNENSREKEINGFLHEKKKNDDKNYYSCVDDIIQISDLINIISNTKNI